MSFEFAIAIDALLAMLILLLAWRVVTSRDLFQAIVLFIALGLLVALAWVRLYAPDAALAEAAIGSGLAGALLLATLARLEQKIDANPTVKFVPSVLFSVVGLGFGLGLVLALLQLPTAAEGLMPWVADQLPAAEVLHPVTAVLLNFRAWDTALELAVLLWVWLAQRGLHPEPAWVLQGLSGQVLQGAVRLVLPLVVVIGVYLLWRGALAPGGAFQSGAILAAGLVMLLLAGTAFKPTGLGLKLAWLAGFWLFMVIGLVGALLGAGFMGYVPGSAAGLIVLIEIAASLSIAFLLAWMLSGEAVLFKTDQVKAARRSV